MANKTVLLVDDDANIRKMTSVRLEREGYRVLTASSGEQGLMLALAERPDVILLDIAMPGMDGREVFARLKADASTKDIPVILLTVVFPAEDGQDNLDGVPRQSKPYKPAELLDKIRTVLT